MKFLEKRYAVLDRMSALQNALKSGPLTTAEETEMKSLERAVRLIKFQFISTIVCICVLLALFAAGLTLNFAQMFSVPGSSSERATSGNVHNALVEAVARCAPDSRMPSLFVVKTANSSFALAASGRDRIGVTAGKIAITQPFAEMLSQEALLAIMAHELGHTQGIDDEHTADMFALKCVGAPALMTAYTESEVAIANPAFAAALQSGGATPREVAELSAALRENVSARRSLITESQRQQ